MACSDRSWVSVSLLASGLATSSGALLQPALNMAL
jgi:hypothetical protein